jgi:hypothetical protein
MPYPPRVGPGTRSVLPEGCVMDLQETGSVVYFPTLNHPVMKAMLCSVTGKMSYDHTPHWLARQF